jgi:hypothetical protein
MKAISVEYPTTGKIAQSFENIAFASNSPLELLPRIKVDSKNTGYHVLLWSGSKHVLMFINLPTEEIKVFAELLAGWAVESMFHECYKQIANDILAKLGY